MSPRLPRSEALPFVIALAGLCWVPVCFLVAWIGRRH